VDLTSNIDAEEEFVEFREESSAPGTRGSTLRIWGFVGAPGVSRATRQDQHLFVNRRPVENRALNYALLEGYHTALMKGRYPVCCLLLELDPAEVDVNIHPAKREVKFRREKAVRREVAEAVRRTLLAFHAGSPAAGSRDPGPSAKDGHESGTQVPPATRNQSDKTAVAVPQTKDLPHFLPPSPSGPISNLPLAASRAAPASPTATLAPPPSAVSRSAIRVLQSNPSPVSTVAVPLLKVPLRLIGVIGRLYVVLESDRGLVLMDQHAAHERILYEQMLRRLEHGDAPSQRLLLPETVELPPRDGQFLREHLAVLGRLGVGLSEFGDRTFLLDALPPFVKVADSRRFVLELIDELVAAGQEVNSFRLGEQTVAKTVCRHAVKANDPLAGPELDSLLNDLRNCAMPYTCPHGRPTLIEMNYRELEKKFGRTQ
jgi:DNA mismatch repair protein MutL